MKVKKKINHLKERIRLNKKTFTLYLVLRALVILTAIRCLFIKNYESFALCIISLGLFLMPSLLEEKLRITFPPLFECFIYLFIYAAEIMGEVKHYYTMIPGWDTMLHTINGFLCAAIGFSLIEILSRHTKRGKLSPIYLALVAFCFSMTIAVLWEFFEFFMDSHFYLDMQKDFIVKEIGSVSLDQTHSQIPVRISDITKTTIETASGETYTIQGGYLDLGIIDTMKDLWVNFIGAITFSIFGFFYELYRHGQEMKGIMKHTAEIAGNLKLSSLSDEELAAQEEEIHRRQEELDLERGIRKHRKRNRT